MPTMANSDGDDADLLADTGSNQQPPRVPGGNDDDIATWQEDTATAATNQMKSLP